MHKRHCWAGRREQIEERYGVNSKEVIATWDDEFKDGICLLEADHEGEHEFTNTEDITVRFTGEKPLSEIGGEGDG